VVSAPEGRALGKAEIRALQMDILRAVDTFCAERGLHYFLWAGTLLGAVREGGFIEWDDDIDLAMPRADFEVLCREFAGPEHLRLYSSSTHASYRYPFARVADQRTRIFEGSRMAIPMGVNVDVFPLDGWPGAAKNGRHRRYLATLHTLVAAWTTPSRRLPKRLARAAVSVLPIRGLTGALTSVARLNSFETAAEVGVQVFRYMEKVDRDAYGVPQQIEFEGERFLAGPADADRILTNLYGDWRTPPPPSARATDRHFTEAVWTG
jgi:lipopolysaccharide cholinephosphotransferase